MFLLLMIASVIVARIGNSLIRKYLDDPMGKRLAKGTARAFQYIVIGTALAVGFSTILQLDLTAIFLSLGVASIAVAFASQQIIQNAISGLLISIIRPIQLEDWVEVGPLPLNPISRVKDITLMNTVLQEADGRIVTVPNSGIINGKVINYTRGGFTAVNISIWIAKVSDLPRITEIINAEASRNPHILPEVSAEGKNILAKFLERRPMRHQLGPGHNLRALDPQVNLAELQRTRARVVIKLWILEPHRREEIVSRFLAVISEKLEQEGIELSDL